ncbi:hypothetical protein KYC5002_40700 [Archangium violaceum]|uniref:hypothetical protein n=1 Tax=Archangium violaceum TaxID=83451 RepID=UPI002B2C868A|nr:hypothetical protein KYC5002_40700 [Archangium gephyra]
MLDTGFDAFAEHPVTLWPEGLREQVDETIDALYEPVNNEHCALQVQPGAGARRPQPTGARTR